MIGSSRAYLWIAAITLALSMAAPAGARRGAEDPDPRDAPSWSTGGRAIAPTGGGPAADRILRERSQPLLGDPAASLRAAADAIANRNRSHAIWLLEQVIQRHRVIADHASVMQIRLLEEDGYAERSRVAARRALAQHPKTPLRAELYVLLADAQRSLGDHDAAFASWRASLDASRDDALRASVLLSIAATQEQQGLDQDAATTYRLLWYAHPTTSEARIASHRLEILEEFLGQSQRDGTTWRRRGDRLFRKRDNEQALDAYDRAIDIGLSSSELRRARRQRAHTLFRLRDYPNAVVAFSELGQKDDVPIWRARSLARAGEVPRAIDEFEEMARKKRSANAVRARYLAALLLDGRGFVDRAEAHYEAVASHSSKSSMGHAAGWRLGWGHYRQGNWSKAIAHFDALISSHQNDPIDQLRPRYWRARSLEKMGEPVAAAEFRVIAQEYPFSYYGWRALDRAGDAGERVVPPREIEAGKGRLDARALERARILLAAGLESQAGVELSRLRRRARGLNERLELAQLLSEAGDYHAAQRLIVDPYAETLARGPQRRLEELWWYAWPSAYSDLVHEATSAPGSVPPELVYSIMREESGYRAKVVSPVGARGLLQIMIPTGERLAQMTGLQSFAADDLFEPRTNIGLGSHYLGELGQHFPGRLSASIASYNAGPQSVGEWKPEAATDDDEWVESIPYDQTRSYVKRVLRSLHAYRVLY